MSKTFTYDSGTITRAISPSSPATMLAGNRNKGGLIQINFYLITVAVTQVTVGSMSLWISWTDEMSNQVQSVNAGGVRVSEIQNSQRTFPINTKAGTPIQYYTEYSLATDPISVAFRVFGEAL